MTQINSLPQPLQRRGVKSALRWLVLSTIHADVWKIRISASSCLQNLSSGFVSGFVWIRMINLLRFWLMAEIASFLTVIRNDVSVLFRLSENPVIRKSSSLAMTVRSGICYPKIQWSENPVIRKSSNPKIQQSENPTTRCLFMASPAQSQARSCLVTCCFWY